MRFAKSRANVPLFLATATLSSALLVAPNSNCGVQCGNVLSSLSGSDLVCQDTAYKSTVAGQTFQSCLNCELNSTFVDSGPGGTNQTDLQWLLYNLRYTVSYCLFGFPNNTNLQDSPCVTSFACGEIQNSTEEYLSTANDTTYGYCDQWATDKLPKCQACLAEWGNVNYIWNYIQALSAGCQYRPAAGKTLSLQGNLFSETPVNITNPAISTNVPIFVQNQGKFNLGARIGIAIGSIVFIVILAGCCIVWRGKRRRRAYLASHAPPMVNTNMPLFHDRQGSSPIGSSPQNESAKGLISSQKPWAASSSYDGSPVDKTYFSPYASHYSSPVSPQDAGVGPSREWQPAAMAKESERTDEIEMAQLGKEERERVERERWAAQSGFSTTDQAPIIRAPMPVRGAGMGSAF